MIQNAENQDINTESTTQVAENQSVKLMRNSTVNIYGRKLKSIDKGIALTTFLKSIGYDTTTLDIFDLVTIQYEVLKAVKHAKKGINNPDNLGTNNDEIVQQTLLDFINNK